RPRPATTRARRTRNRRRCRGREGRAWPRRAAASSATGPRPARAAAGPTELTPSRSSSIQSLAPRCQPVFASRCQPVLVVTLSAGLHYHSLALRCQPVFTYPSVALDALWLSLVSFLSTCAGGLFALKFRDRLHLILGFTAGVLLGVV